MVLVQQVTYRINNFEMAGCIPVSSTYDPIELMFLREKKKKDKNVMPCWSLILSLPPRSTIILYCSTIMEQQRKASFLGSFGFLSPPPVRSLTLRVFPFHPISKEMMWMCRCLILQQKARFGTCWINSGGSWASVLEIVDRVPGSHTSKDGIRFKGLSHP